MHTVTPLIHSQALGRRLGSKVYLKLKSAQPVGSFKIRGVGFACREYARRGARAFVSSSGGNAGLAVSYAGRLLGLPVRVVVPTTTPQRARDLIAQEGATVRVLLARRRHRGGLACRDAGGADLAVTERLSAPLRPTGHRNVAPGATAPACRPMRADCATAGDWSGPRVDRGPLPWPTSLPRAGLPRRATHPGADVPGSSEADFALQVPPETGRDDHPVGEYPALP